MVKKNQAILEMANITVTDVMQAISWCNSLIAKYREEVKNFCQACILAKNDTESIRLRAAERNSKLYLREFEHYRACLLDLLDGESCEVDLASDDVEPENVRTLMTILRDARFVVMMANSNLNPVWVLGDPNRVSIREYMLRVHPDRVRWCRSSLRLTCCSDLVLENQAFLIANEKAYSPMSVLTNMLGYDEDCARDALLGSLDAIWKFKCSPASTWVQPTSVMTATDNYHYIPSRFEREQEGDFDEYLSEKADWIPKLVKEKSNIQRIGRKIAFINGNGNYLELVDPDHCLQERARFSVGAGDYWRWRYDSGEVKALFILGSVRDACRLIDFFSSFIDLDGIVFVSIGSAFRSDAAIRAIYDNMCSNIYTGLFNRGCMETVNEIERIFPWSKRIPWKEKLVKAGISNDELAKMMPEEIRKTYFSRNLWK